MKKILTVAVVSTMLLGMMGITASAQTTDEADVYVTISDKDGNLAMAQKKIVVTDVDNDDVLTINDALYCAHEAEYEGGADAGYASAYGDYGLSLNKLWGTANGGSYGYYVNNNSAWSLTDTVNEGDYVNAFVYTDLTNWSDTYCYFDVNNVSTESGEEITLTLSAAGYDSEYNPVAIPVENAVITLNGEKTDYKTDKDGKVIISIKDGGYYVISAVSDTQVLVPPVCNAVVSSDNEATASTNPTSVTETPTEVPSVTNTASPSEVISAPKTGSDNALAIALFIAIASFGTVVIVSAKRRQNYEK